MAFQIAVPIQNSEITALVTYYFPAPYRIEYLAYETKEYVVYATTGHRQELRRFADINSILEWCEKERQDIEVTAKIHNVVFLEEQYAPQALKIYGSDFDLINRELADISRLTYKSAAAFLAACSPEYDY